jgi:hypothetical protein
VALAHRFVSGGSFDESVLWQARDAIVESSALAARPVPHDWPKVHQALVRAVAKTPRLLEKDREQVMVALRIAAPRSDLAVADVERYLASHRTPLPAVLRVFEDLSRQERQGNIERLVIECRSRGRRFSNNELSRLWNIACSADTFDEAWRAGTILHSRNALHRAVVQSWEVSGENRREYGFSSLTVIDARTVLFDFEPEMARFCESLLVVGPALTELLAVLAPSNSAFKPSWKSKSLEKDVATALDKAAWMPKGRKRYRFGVDSESDSSLLRPPFLQSLSVNSWSCALAELAERLGLYAWRWDVKYLASMIEDMLPGTNSRFDVVGRPGKIARWMRSLSPEERAAWNHVQRLAHALDEKQVTDSVGVFLVRLATLFCQNHFQALTSLQAMRAPMGVLNGLERWIVSREYTTVRSRLGSKTIVPVPVDLRQVNPQAVVP